MRRFLMIVTVTTVCWTALAAAGEPPAEKAPPTPVATTPAAAPAPDKDDVVVVSPAPKATEKASPEPKDKPDKKAKSKDKPDKKAKAKAKPAPKPDTTAKAEPAPKGGPTPKPDTTAKAEPTPKPDTTAKAEPAPKGEPTTTPDATPTTKPAPKEDVVVKPEPKPAPRPKPELKPELKPAPQRDIIFQFDRTPYADVVRRFSQMADKPLIGDLSIAGELTFYDSMPYTYDEAFEMLNTMLAMKGFRLTETGRYFQLVPMDQAIQKAPFLRGQDPTTVKDVRPDQIVTMVLPLKYLDASDAAKAIVRMVSSFGSITPLGKGKGLIVTDRLDNIKRLRVMLDALDSETVVERTLRAIPLKHASAREMSTVVKSLLGSGSTARKMVYDRNLRKYVPDTSVSSSSVIVTSDERTNTLLLLGTTDKLAMAQEMIATLDIDKTESPVTGGVKVFELKNARAADLADTIKQLLPSTISQSSSSSYYSRYRTSSTTGGKQPARVVADPGTNRLIVSADVEDMAKIEGLVRELDKASVDVGGVKVIPLEVADASQLASVVTSAVRKIDSRGRVTTPLLISPDTRTNSLIVSGPAGDIKAAEVLITQLDKKLDKEVREIRVIRLTSGNAVTMAQSLMRLFSQTTSSSRYSSSYSRYGSSSSSRSASSFRVEAEATTNSLIISASPQEWPIIEKLLKDLQAGFEEGSPHVASLKMIPLKHADATELARTLGLLYRYRRGAVPVIITASKRGNSLLVSAGSDEQETIAGIVKSLDVEETEEINPVRIIRLDSADATQLVATLRGMLPRTSSYEQSEIFLQAEPGTNSVLIRAPASESKILEEMVATLDKATQDTARATRIIPLENTSASALASTLAQLYRSSSSRSSYSSSYSKYSRYVPTSSAGDDVIITPAPNDRALVVDAPLKDIEKIEQLAKSLDTEEQAVDKLTVRTYQLEKASASDLARSLAKLYMQQVTSSYSRTPTPKSSEPQPRFEAETSTNQLLVAATEKQFPEIEKLIEKLQAAAVLTRISRTFQLKFAKSADIVSVLQSMLRDTSSSSRYSSSSYSRYSSGSTTRSEPVRIASLPYANSIVIEGPPDKLTMAEQLIKTFDVPEAAKATSIQVIRLTNAQASSLATAINAILAGQASRSTSSRYGSSYSRTSSSTASAEDRVTVTPEPNSNSVLVRGPADEIPAVVEMIKALDKDSDSQGIQVRTFLLEKGEASAVSQTLGTMFRDIIRQKYSYGSGMTPPTFTVAADDRTNTLIVSTTPGHFALVEQLLESLENAPQRPVNDVEYFWLLNADAGAVKTKIDAMYAARRGTDKPVVEVDDYTNSVTVIAKAEDMLDITPVINKLDEGTIDNTVQVRMFPLADVRAEKMAEVIKSVYSQLYGEKVIISNELPKPTTPDGAAGESLLNPIPDALNDPGGATKVFPAPKEEPKTPATQPATKPAAETPEAKTPTEEEPVEEEPATVTISVDATANALLVSGTRSQLDAIDQIILDLASAAEDAEAEFRIFRIKNADPVELAKTLDAMFNPKMKINTAALKAAQAAQQNGRSSKSGATPRITLPPPPPPVITVVPDARTRSLIIRAKPMDFDIITPLLDHLDAEEGSASEIRVFVLQNTDATEVAKNLTDLLKGPTPIIPSSALRPGTSSSSKSKSSSSGQAQRAEMVRQMLQMQATAGKGSVSASTTEAVSISANRQTNSVIVSATPDTMKLVERLIQELDQSAALAKVPAVRLYPLEHAEVSTTVSALTRIFSGAAAGARRTPGAAQQTPIVITGDEAGGVVIVSAPIEKHELIEKVITDIDGAQGTDEVTVRVYKIEYAQASTVAGALTTTLSGSSGARVTSKSGKGSTRSGAAAGALRISPDASTNSLIVRATEEQHTEITKLIAQIDTPPMDEYPVQLIRLNNADATTVAGVLQRVFAGATVTTTSRSSRSRTGATPSKGRVPLLIEADPESSLIMVRTDEDTFEKVRALAAQLDEASPAGQLKQTVIPLKNATASTVSRAVGQAFAPPRGKRISPEDVVTVVYEQMSNVLIVTANDKNLKKVQDLVAKLDTTVGARTELLVLENARATEIATALSRLTTSGGSRSKAGTQQELVIAADAGSNALILTGPSAELDRMMQMARDLDQASQGREGIVKMYPVKNADVETMVAALQRIFPSTTGSSSRYSRTSRGGATADDVPVVIVGDELAETVIVSASPEKHELIAKVITDMDEALPPDQLVIKVYKVEYADAASVATTITTTMSTGTSSRTSRTGAAAKALRISADRSTNSLIARATQEDHKEIARLLSEIDTSEVDEYPVRLIPLATADPTNVAATLNRLFGGTTSRTSSSSRYRSSSSRSTTSSRGADVVIEADADSRMLMVRADEKTFEKIRELAAKLDAEDPSGKAKRTILALENAQAATVASALTQAFSPRRGERVEPDDLVTVVAEPMSNSVIVTANEKNLAKVQTLLGKLDSEGATRTEMLLLKNSEAADLATVLTKMAGSASSSRSRSGASSGVVIAADAGANALIMSGPAGDLDKLMKMAVQLDQTTPDPAGVYILPLENGDAVEVAGMVQDIIQQQIKTGGKRTAPQAFAVTADERANTLIIATSQEIYQQVEQWVKQIDKMTPRKGNLQLIKLEHADPEEVQRAIDQLFGGKADPKVRPSRSGGSSRNTGSRTSGKTSSKGTTSRAGNVETTVLPEQRALLINASPEDYEAILKLAKSLDEAAAGLKREVEIFNLKHANNSRIAQAVSGVYKAAARAGRAEDQVTVTPLTQTNAVMVAATKEKMAEIRHLIEQLDKADVASPMEFKVYPLANTMPTKILPLLTKMVTEYRKARPDQVVNVQADERTRSIIVTASGPVFAEIEKMIKQLDVAPAYGAAEVLIIPLKRADATRLAEVLNEMLRPAAANVVTPEARALQEQLRLLRVRSALKDGVPDLDLTKPIKITADPQQTGSQGSNALIITSTAENLKAMEAIVSILDTVPLADGVTVRVIHLKNANAESAVEVLREVFDQAATTMSGRRGSSVAGKAEPDTTAGKALVNAIGLSADMRTNSIVISGQEETVALAEVLLKDLDKVDGQIVTEVRLFQLKHADAGRLAPVLQSVFAEGRAEAGTEGILTQVTRLKTVLIEDKKKGIGRPIEKGNTTEIPKTREALTIQADETTNILVVAARSDVMPLIADVITNMDIPGAGSLNTVRFFPLVHADATRVSAVIDSLYKGPNANLIRDEDKPTLAVDARTNALIVSANEKTFAMITALLKQLDAKQPIELRDIRLLPLKNAEATALASTLTEMMDARVQRMEALGIGEAEALRVIIVADERSNSLIVGGSAESFGIVKDLATQLDGANPALGGQVQIHPLKHGNAGTIGSTLSDLFDKRYDAARTADVKRQRPIILPDLRINALLVAANTDDTKVLKSLLAKLDVELTDPAVQLVVIPMLHNDAGVIGPMLESLFEARLRSMTPPDAKENAQDRVDIEIDSLSNSLVISASKENLTLIAGLLKKLDVEPPDKTGIVRIYLLKNADAQRVATLLQSLISQGLYKPGMLSAGRNAALQAREKVAIVTDVRTNTVIVSASKENFAVIEELITRLDSTDDFTLLGDIRMFVLKYADATRLATTLSQFFSAKLQAETAAGSSGRALSVTFIPDARTNTLLVAGSRESYAAVEAMVKKLDNEQVVQASEFRVFYLKHATATALQPTLERLFTQRVARGNVRDPITVIADPKTNALLVGASSADMKLAEDLIAQLDSEADKKGFAMHVFPLEKADAAQVASTLESLFQSQGTTAGVAVSVDERINALIVSAGDADAKRIAELIKQLDKGAVTRVTEIKIFTLKNADASELADILTSALTSKPASPTPISTNRQTLLQFITQTKDGKDLIASALQEGVLITPDVRTNSLVVSAPIENMPLLESLVKAMDSTSPRMAEIRVFPLTNADAASMADVLRELFRLEGTRPTGEQAVRYTYSTTTQPAAKETSNGASNGAGKDVGKSAATVGSAEQISLTVTVDVRTNSLLVGGTKQYVELASNVILELDSSPAQERMTQIYRLRNAQAADIQTALDNFLSQERQRMESILGSDGMGAAQRILEREVAIVAEATSNTLLLSASPRYFKTVEGMIKELDQPPPQVLIQVLLAEVTLDDTNELGMDWQFAGSSGGKSISTGTDFNISGEIATKNGFSLSVTGGDLDFFLRALQAQGRLEVLSRPQILASDNQQASINVGQRVPFVTASRISDNGNVTNTIQYQDVGIILRVTPRINPDGFVKMQVAPEISSISTSTVDISEGVSAVIINTRQAETTVSVQDGHTIVLGGLIETKDEDREEKVPILGDIPLLGLLFRSTSVVKERSELLIILTPHVLSTIDLADKETAEQVKRLKFLRGAASDRDPLKDYLYDPINHRSEPSRRAGRATSLENWPMSPGWERVLPLELLPQLDKDGKKGKDGADTPEKDNAKEPAK